MVDLATQLLMDREGFSPTAYWDVNHWRAGYGSDTWTDDNGAVHNVTSGTTVTAAQAASDLARRAGQTQQRVVGQIGQSAWNSLGEGARAALTSFAYNYGDLTPSVARAARIGDNQAIASAIEARGVDNGGVNAARRTAEAAVVLGHPVPPADIPSNADPINGGALQNPALMLPYSAPAPLTPPTGNVFGGRLPPAAMNGVDRLIPGQVTQPPTDFTTDPSGAVDPRLSSMLAPQVPRVDPIGPGPGSFAALQAMLPKTAPPLPVNRPATPIQAAPVPMPTPSFAAPVVSAPAAANLVRLPSGKMIAPGTYPVASNPGSMTVISNDGNGNAVVKTVNPGFANLAKMGSGTVAGSIVGKTIADTYNSAKPQVETALSNAASNVGKTASDLGSNVLSGAQNIGSGAMGLLGNLFGGAKPPSVPAAPPFAPSGQSPGTPLTPEGSYTPPRTTTIANPAYAQWQAQYGDPAASYRDAYQTAAAYGDPAASYRDGYQASMTAPAIPAAPPKYLTKTIPGVPVMPATLPSFMRPVMPQSSVFLNNPVAQATSKSNLGGLLQFLSGGGNNYGYITAAPGMTQAQTSAALIAQQNQSPTVNYNGGAQTTTASGTPLQNIAAGQRWAAAFM